MKRKNFKTLMKETFRQGILIQKFVLFVIMKMGLSNKSIFRLQEELLIYNLLKKKYWNDINVDISDNKECTAIKKIWFCWLQGMENTPSIVRLCYESVKNNAGDWELNVITKDNMFDYVQMPDYIVRKWKEGVIGNAHFADMLRLELLDTYGGLWLDATVFLTGGIPDYIFSRPLFMYSHRHRNNKVIEVNNWLIYSQKSDPVLKESKKLLYEYWRKETYCKHYFLYQILFSVMIEKYPEIREYMGFYSDINPHLLHYDLFEKYDDKKYDYIKQLTNIHKLSNRYDVPDNVEGMFYERIVSDKI